MKFLIMQFPPVSSFFHPLRSLYSILKCLQLMFFPQYEKPVFKPIQKICKITVLYILFLWIDSKWEYKIFLAECWQVYSEFTISSQTIPVPVETAF